MDRLPLRTLIGVCLVMAGSLASACSNDPASPVGPREVDFSLNGTGTLVGQDFAPGFPAERSDFGGRCSVPSDFVIRFSISGTATLIGPVTSTLEHCSQVDMQAGTSTITDGEQVIRSSGGADELRATYASPEDPDSPFDELVVFTGGTGRFEGATGEGTALVQCDRETGMCMYDMAATLTLVAS